MVNMAKGLEYLRSTSNRAGFGFRRSELNGSVIKKKIGWAGLLTSVKI